MLKKKASLSREQIEKIQDWFGENYTLDDFARACNKFDTKTERRDIARLCKQQPALNAGVYMTSNEINNVSEPPVNSREDGRLFTSGKGPSESQEPESIIIDGRIPMETQETGENNNFMVGEQNPDDGSMWEIDDSSSSDSSFDWEYYDDDGNPLVHHEDDSELVPMENKVWYTEEEADKLLIFAASHRETRSGLQKTKNWTRPKTSY